MSFWSTSDGASITAQTEYEIEGGGGLIPDNTNCLAYIDEAKIDSKDGAEYVSLRWRVAKPETLKNRVVFQKLWIYGNNPNQSDAAKAQKQGDKAKRMLAAIDANAGGELLVVDAPPTDERLQSALVNKFMVVKVKTWEMKGDQGDTMQGNWIAAVMPKTHEISESVKAQEQKPKAVPAAAATEYDDEIPF